MSVRLAQRVERDESTWHDHVRPDPRVEAGDPVIDAEAYAPALGKSDPAAMGRSCVTLDGAVTLAGQAADVLRLAGRVVYDRMGRGTARRRGLKQGDRVSLDEMSDEQVLDAWHAAMMTQRYAVTEDPSVRMAMKLKAEAAAIRRFGVGEHLQAYRKRYPEDTL